MKNFKIEAMIISAKSKKEAVNKYLEQYFSTFNIKCQKSFNALSKITKEIL